MKRVLFFAILLSTCLNCFSQNYTPDQAMHACYFPECFKLDNSKVSKGETIKWLAQKLNAYPPIQFSKYYYYRLGKGMSSEESKQETNYDITYYHWTFKEDVLVFEMHGTFAKNNLWSVEELNSFDPSFTYGSNHAEENINIRYEIPIAKLQRVFTIGNLDFKTFNKDIIEDENGKIFYTDEAYIEFDDRMETNIDIRLKKAFVHLVHSYWKPVKGEAY